jgi:hypothetical protein
MGGSREFVKRIPFNKGKNLIDDPKMAAIYFTPGRLFMDHEMKDFRESPAGTHATLQERQKRHKFLKDKFIVLPQDIMEV